jgi:hypothetical protein
MSRGGDDDRAGDGDGFLSRWSRRKRGADAPRDPAPEAAPGPLGADAPPTPEEEAEAVAALPPLESITATTDLGPWLRRGVPAALKNLALRRMWSLDPAIRDYRDLAVDYAWDWNAPGGLPGGGGVAGTEGVARLLRGLTGEPEPVPTSAPAPAAPAPAAPAPEAAPTPPAVADSAPSADRNAPPAAADAAPPPAPDPAPPARAARADPAPAPRTRRHGGAAPT